MAKAVGLDIGSHSCKVVVIEGGPKGAKVLRYAEHEYPRADGGVLTPAAVLETLKKTLSEAKAPKQVVCFSMPAEECILREITVPFSQDEQIRKVVRFEFEPHLHNAAIEDVVLDFIKTGPARGGTRLLIFACHKDRLTKRLEQLRQVGVDPLHVDIGMASLFNVAHAAGVFEEHPNCLIIDIGARTTKAVYVQDAALKVARSIRLGANAVRQRLSTDLEGETQAIDDALEDAQGAEGLALPPEGIADTMQIVQSVKDLENSVARTHQSDFMARVLRETQRTLPGIGDERRPTRVYLTGGGANHAHARQRISDHFGVEVEDLPVTSAVSHKLSPEKARQLQTSGAVAVGAALKVLGIDAANIDLRQDEFKFARTFDQLKTALATGVTLLFFATFLGLLIQIIEKRKVDAEFLDVKKEIQTALRVDVFDAYETAVADGTPIKISNEKDKFVSTVGTGLKKIRGKLKDELGLATEVPPILSGLKSWSTVMQALKDVRGDVKYLAVKSEKYDQERALLTVIVGNYSDIDAITRKLKAYDRVIAKLEARRPKTVDQGIEITIQMDLVPPTWEDEASSTGALPSSDPVRTAKGEVK